MTNMDTGTENKETCRKVEQFWRGHYHIMLGHLDINDAMKVIGWSFSGADLIKASLGDRVNERIAAGFEWRVSELKNGLDGGYPLLNERLLVQLRIALRARDKDELVLRMYEKFGSKLEGGLVSAAVMHQDESWVYLTEEEKYERRAWVRRLESNLEWYLAGLKDGGVSE